MTANQLADQAWRKGGSRDPAITEARMLMTSAGGRPADPRAALRDAHPVVARRNGNADPAWVSLAARTAQIGGRLARITDPSVQQRRSANPKRPARTPRFLRAG